MVTSVKDYQLIVTHSLPPEQQHDCINSGASAKHLLHFLLLLDLERRSLQQAHIDGWSHEILPQTDRVLWQMRGCVGEEALSKRFRCKPLTQLRRHTSLPFDGGVRGQEPVSELAAQLIRTGG